MPIKITKIQALNILLCLLTAVFVFHLLVITGTIPYEIVWAGKLKSDDEMYVFEATSILINLILLLTLLVKRDLINDKPGRSKIVSGILRYYIVLVTLNSYGNLRSEAILGKIINGILWLFIVLFALNTIGNLLAKTDFEKYVFTPMTLVFAILLWIIVRKQKTTRDIL